jgi:hypothetical protein
MKTPVLFLSMTIAAALVPGAANGAILIYNATLSGANESPPVASLGSGFSIVTIDDVANTMRVEVSFVGLSGTTTAAHIHAATTLPLLGNAGVATQTPTFSGFPSGVTSGIYDHTFDMTMASSYNAAFVTSNGGTAASAFAALSSALASDRAYLNIHSSTFGGGEIRGFLTAVPEPATASLLGLAASLCLLRRRRSAR